MPDISKWKTEKLIAMDGLFSDCDLVLYFPDISISKWNNYKSDHLYKSTNYDKLKQLINFSTDISILSDSPENDDILNNKDFMEKQIGDKLDKFLF